MARVILGAAAAVGALPPLPRRHAPAPHAKQTPEQRDAALAKAEAKRARKRARRLVRERRCAACGARAASHPWTVNGSPALCATCDESIRIEIAHDRALAEDRDSCAAERDAALAHAEADEP